MVMKPFVRKGLHFPAFHSRGHDCDPIDAAGGVRDVSADIFEALVSEKLTRPSHIVFAFEAVLSRIVTIIFYERRSGNGQVRVL